MNPERIPRPEQNEAESVESLKAAVQAMLGEDYSPLNNPELKRVLDEVVAVNTSEQHEDIEFSVPTYEGFENDPDLRTLQTDLEQAFGKELLQACIISRFVNRPDIANVLVGGKDYYMDVMTYEKLAQNHPSLRNYKVRAENFADWARNGHITSVTPLPIHIYSFTGEDLSAFPYLDDVAPEEKMKIYKFGTVAHEVAHHILEYLLTEEEKRELVTLAGTISPLTPYTAKYQTGKHHKPEHYANEQFCEGVRLMTTSSNYLQRVASGLYSWLRNNLPDVRALHS